jgi:phospholipid/cholesterol/gamma-HCH transport system substrate-binding protein
MSIKKVDNIKLGLFVLTGALFLIFSLYMIGKNRNLFGSTFTIHASFRNVNGLMPGNNVRFSGIDVGTVKAISFESDTTVRVDMILDKKLKKYIKKNAIAAVGTDGLMGNKLINITGHAGNAQPVEDGDRILSLIPVETDEMLRTLNTTNDNIAVITTDLKKITQKINNSSGLWKLLSDSVIARDIKLAAINIKEASHNAAKAGEEFAEMAKQARTGTGLAGTLISDTSLSNQFRSSIADIKNASDELVALINNVNDAAVKMKQGNGTMGVLMSDSIMAERLNKTMMNLEQGTGRFNENMEAMKHNFLFKGYFEEQEKAAKKKKK